MFFLDSGAHSLYNLHVKGKDKKKTDTYKFYRTKKFYRYLDHYARFVKKYAQGIDLYVNVDAIYNAELSWKALKYLENEHGLSPVPVIHHRTPMVWVDRHLEAGYDLLGIGGLGQESTKSSYTDWADRLFDRICVGPKRLPIVRTHGFAMTSYDLLLRYPWWAVDSASWAKCAAFGSVFVPHRRNGEYTFAESPYVVCMSDGSASKQQGKHYRTFSRNVRLVIDDWLSEVGVPIGDEKTKGVTNHYGTRAVANMRFFQRLCEWLPEWPWPFNVTVRRGFFG